MKGGIFAFIAGLAAAYAVSVLRSDRLAVRAAARLTTLDLNHAPASAFAILGLDSETADRIIENRPYRNKLDLLERFVLAQGDYDLIKNRISTDAKHADDPVVVAS